MDGFPQLSANRGRKLGGSLPVGRATAGGAVETPSKPLRTIFCCFPTNQFVDLAIGRAYSLRLDVILWVPNMNHVPQDQVLCS